MNWQNIAIIAIGIVAAAYTLRGIVRVLCGKRSCSGCPERNCPHKKRGPEDTF